MQDNNYIIYVSTKKKTSGKKSSLFYRLHRDLDGSKSENLEEKCQSLQQEVKKLQQQLWQKQMRKHQQKQQNNISLKQTASNNSVGFYILCTMYLFYIDNIVDLRLKTSWVNNLSFRKIKESLDIHGIWNPNYWHLLFIVLFLIWMNERVFTSLSTHC